ncbi:hypothetical protein BH09BAC6_BH09BAC6_00190 [soil metagenome]|jgi:hypothetical protein
MPDEPLSTDPEENLRMENELLKLKLKAELGAESHSISNIDPEIENEFLKNILAFEHSYAKSKRVKIIELLGHPDFEKADELSDDEIPAALEKLAELLLNNNMVVDFGGDYDDRVKYRFITEELFEHEADDFKIPGMIAHFDYEEFHPNHQLDIERRATEFISQWFRQTLDKKSWELSDPFVLPDRKILSKSEVAAQFKNIFDAYTSFTDQEYIINDIGFQLHDEGGLGHAEGTVRYTAVLENGETVVFAGPFKLYMEMQHGWWSIFHIIFPGFEYQ